MSSLSWTMLVVFLVADWLGHLFGKGPVLLKMVVGIATFFWCRGIGSLLGWW